MYHPGRLDLVFHFKVGFSSFVWTFLWLSFWRGWGDRALQKCNLSTQCARGLQESIPRPSLLGRVLFFLDALQTRLKAKNLSHLVGSAAIFFFLLGLRMRGRAVAQPIASTGDLNIFGVVE